MWTRLCPWVCCHCVHKGFKLCTTRGAGVAAGTCLTCLIEDSYSMAAFTHEAFPALRVWNYARRFPCVSAWCVRFIGCILNCVKSRQKHVKHNFPKYKMQWTDGALYSYEEQMKHSEEMLLHNSISTQHLGMYAANICVYIAPAVHYTKLMPGDICPSASSSNLPWRRMSMIKTKLFVVKK